MPRSFEDYTNYEEALDEIRQTKSYEKKLACNIKNDREKWLTDRRQRVVVDGEVSNWKSVLSGAPQE